ncbi:hypothetical protein [Pseudoalteromonas sp. G4]|uniref:hypothetical protein n=1 Tax=Pseudoalteromonas sp. G4 TaxID=2992761 RepID=UPI00237D9BE2|nr:hypothetical protein [Pseudoalteromonas sp. G4]MDE3271530.1 hypothetical protein [Pseudoalteromonas sp. G4]
MRELLIRTPSTLLIDLELTDNLIDNSWSQVVSEFGKVTITQQADIRKFFKSISAKHLALIESTLNSTDEIFLSGLYERVIKNLDIISEVEVTINGDSFLQPTLFVSISYSSSDKGMTEIDYLDLNYLIIKLHNPYGVANVSCTYYSGEFSFTAKVNDEGDLKYTDVGIES